MTDLNLTIGVGVISLVSFVVIVKFLVNAFLNQQRETQIIMHTDLKTKICDNKDEIKVNRRRIDRNSDAIFTLAGEHMTPPGCNPLEPNFLEGLETPISEPDTQCKSEKEKFDETMKGVRKMYPPK